jgi:hypothetical protein
VPTEDRCVPDPADAPPPSGDRPLSRRLALSGLAALAGSAVAAAVASPALAQTATTGATGTASPAGTSSGAGAAASTTAPAPTTTAPPKRPTPADQVLLGFAQSLELAAAQLYTQAIPGLSKDWQPIAAIFGRHHQSYGEQIGALLGRRAPGVANQTLLDQYGPKFGGGEQAVLGGAYELEISLAASYTQLLGQLKGTDGITLVASVQPVEARQAVVLGQATNVSDQDLMPVVEGEEPGATVFTLSQYPII